jgi:hypothetical protein
MEKFLISNLVNNQFFINLKVETQISAFCVLNIKMLITFEKKVIKYFFIPHICIIFVITN